MFRRKTVTPQSVLWIPAQDLPTSPAHTFYERLNRALAKIDFGTAVRARCAPHYMEEGRGGRPGIDPEVYFKMQMIGFFENLPSERAIAARCADSLAVRQFLRYALTESTPDHSSLTLIRQRLPGAVYEAVFAQVLRALKKHHLLKGRRLAIDASVLEANASLRSLEHRLTGEAYAEYVKRLAAAAGVDAADPVAVRRFDRRRPGRKTSNRDWQHPADPDAKIGPLKRGGTRMIYKPEHLVDLDTGAIVDADVRPGDEADTAQLADRVLKAEARLNRALGAAGDTARWAVLVGDRGYHDPLELATLQAEGIRTAIPDRVPTRPPGRLTAVLQRAVDAAARMAGSVLGRAWLRRRGEHVERSFAHVLDHGGARRTTLRGRANVRKRYLAQTMTMNLSLLMRRLTGLGTPKQALAT